MLSTAPTHRPAARWAASLMTAAALVAAAGCESNKKTRTTRSDTEPRSTVRTASQTGTATTRTVAATRGTRQTSATLDNVLRITKYLPTEVVAGNPFQYQVTVENTSDNLMLRNVWIREHEGFMHSLGGQTAMMGPQGVPMAVPAGGAGMRATTVGGGGQPAVRTASQPGTVGGVQPAGMTMQQDRAATTMTETTTTVVERDLTIDTRDQRGEIPPLPRPADADANITAQSRQIRDESRNLDRDLERMAARTDEQRRDTAGLVNQPAGQRDALSQQYEDPRQDPTRPDIRTTGYEQRQGIPTPGPGGAEQSDQPGQLNGAERTVTERTIIRETGMQQQPSIQQTGMPQRGMMGQPGPVFRPVGMAPPGFQGEAGGRAQDYFVGDLAPGESRTITVSSVVPGAGEHMICTSAAYTPMMCSLVSAIQPQLQLTKAAPEEAAIGQEIVYRLTVTNTGVGPARDVVIVDPLPGDMRTAQGQNQVQIDVGTLEAGESRTFTLNGIAPGPGRYTNIARVTAAGGLTDEAQASTNVRQARLRIEKRGPEVEYTNIGADFEIAVTNEGDAPAYNVMLEDIMPPGARFLEASDGGVAGADRVSWNLGTIPPGQTRTILVRMAGMQAGTLENCAVATAAGVEPVRDCTTVRFEGIAALLLEVVDLDDPIRVGGRTTYEITVINQGSAEVTNISLDTELDERTRFATADGPSPFGRTDVGASFRPLPTLGPGQRATFRVVVDAQAPGDTRFRVNMRADQLTRPVIETESTRIVE